MYTNNNPYNVEDRCYDPEHIESVLEVISKNFKTYFSRYIETDGGVIKELNIKSLEDKFGISSVKKKNPKDIGLTYKSIINDAIEKYESDRAKYLKILDPDYLDEFYDSPQVFKSKILRNECPIIRATINMGSKALDKYRANFNACDPNLMLDVTFNLVEFALDYIENTYNEDEYDNISEIDDLGLYDLDFEPADKPYSANGVIGGGIRSHFLYKISPAAFPNRGRMALWALWYLTDNKTFGCHTDSEFIMVDINKCITQQNYFYPYELFTYYAFHIYKMLKEKADEYGVNIDTKYRYVLVESFLNFVAGEHITDIELFSHQISNEGRGYD
ncbi:MAG: hypothetical protein Q4D21_08135 [Phascolarctobacterium sp.]|nr:hypothetical protein [Phascolarctobacterium sp.]